MIAICFTPPSFWMMPTLILFPYPYVFASSRIEDYGTVEMFCIPFQNVLLVKDYGLTVNKFYNLNGFGFRFTISYFPTIDSDSGLN